MADLSCHKATDEREVNQKLDGSLVPGNDETDWTDGRGSGAAPEMIVRKTGRKAMTADARRSSSSLLGALLAACLWHAPIPWIHTHDAESGHDHHLPAASLAWHLHHFHSDGDEPEGWHVHLTLPWDVFRTPNGKPDPAAPAPGWVFEMPFTLSDGGTALANHDVTAAPPALLAFDRETTALHAQHATPVCGLHFMQTYSSTVPLRTLICVVLC